LQLHVAGRVAWRRGQHVANGTASEGEEGQQESSATVVHAKNLRTVNKIIRSRIAREGS